MQYSSRDSIQADSTSNRAHAETAFWWLIAVLAAIALIVPFIFYAVMRLAGHKSRSAFKHDQDRALSHEVVARAKSGNLWKASNRMPGAERARAEAEQPSCQAEAGWDGRDGRGFQQRALRVQWVMWVKMARGARDTKLGCCGLHHVPSQLSATFVSDAMLHPDAQNKDKKVWIRRTPSDDPLLQPGSARLPKPADIWHVGRFTAKPGFHALRALSH